MIKNHNLELDAVIYVCRLRIGLGLISNYARLTFEELFCIKSSTPTGTPLGRAYLSGVMGSAMILKATTLIYVIQRQWIIHDAHT